MLSVTSDIDASVADLQAMPLRVKKATARSLNRAIGTGQTFMSRIMAKDTGLKVADIKKAFTLSKADPDRLSASLRAAGGKRLPLINFGAKGKEPSRGRGDGVSYNLLGIRKTLQSSFIATMPSGHRGVFLRVKGSRLPIRELFGPSLGKVFDKYRPDGQRATEDAFIKNFTHEFRFQLGQEPEPQDAPDTD